jgi:hypothetical protein
VSELPSSQMTARKLGAPKPEDLKYDRREHIP